MSTRATELQSYKGEWQPNTEYQYGDIVKRGGILYICDIAHTSGTKFEDKENEYFIAFDTSNTNNSTLQKGLLQMLHHLPVIHTQKTYGLDGEIVIKYPYEKVPNNSLLFVIPLKGSIQPYGTFSNKLVINYSKVVTENGVSKIEEGPSKKYNIYIENHDGSKRSVGLGDISPDRLCVFRFLNADSDIVILCNNPIYNNLYCSTLTITNQTMFYERPSIIDGDKNSDTYGLPKDYVAYKSELTKTAETADAAYNRIKTGTDTAEKYFKENSDLPVGTIYLQTEE